MIRVVLPYHLRRLANVDGEVALEVAGPVTQRTVPELVLDQPLAETDVQLWVRPDAALRPDGVVLGGNPAAARTR